MRKHLNSRTFWLIFLSALVTLLCMSMGIYLYTWQADMRRDLEAAHRESDESVEAITDYMDGVFKGATVMASSLNSTEWVQKLCADSAVFDDVFDYVRQRQIASDYLFHVGDADVISRRFVVFPYIDVCIGWKVWADTPAYFGLLGVPQNERSALLDSIRQENEPTTIHVDFWEDVLLVSLPVEAIDRPRAYLCSCVDVDILQERIRQMMAPGVVGVRVTHGEDGKVLFEEGLCGPGDSIRVHSYDARYIDWHYELFVDTAIASVEYSYSDMHVVRYGLTITLLCALVSYVMAVALYTPIMQLMKRAGIRRHEAMRGVSDYQVLGDHFEHMAEHYRHSRRIGFLHQLLNGFFSENEEILHSVGLPLREGCYYRVFVFVGKGTESGEEEREEAHLRLERFLNDRELVYETLDTVSSEIILIIVCGSEQEAENLPRDEIRELFAGTYDVYWGGVSGGLVGISLSYQAAREKRRRMAGIEFSRFYLPLEWENQWMDALLNGKLSIAERICQELQRENERRLAAGKMSRRDYDRLLSALIDDLNRVAGENNLRGVDMLAELVELYAQGETEQIWTGIQNVCSALCDRGVEVKPTGDMPQQIVAYIDGNYGNSGLSLTQLGDVFGLSANTINKCIRQARGMTFHAYLTRCRIERAKELLASKECRISEVAEQVGYDTEYSFRRAFHRYTGIKAQTYEAEDRQ